MPEPTLWKWDHAEPITWAEYHYWMTHVLPFGWSVTPPAALTPDKRREEI
jgi:hypothetical protein